MKPKNGWTLAALFMIVLVLTIPFYSANALAVSVQITHNSGENNIPQFIDAQNDVWKVEATITNAPEETIDPKNVKIKIGNNEAKFQSCSSTALGIACEYISPLTDGVQENEYAFQTVYHFTSPIGLPDFVSNGDVIKADGSGPEITFSGIEQNSDGKLELDFTVNDKVNPAVPSVGIKNIDVMDADSGKVLQTITIPEKGVQEYNYINDGDFNGVLPVFLGGEGQKRFKIRAEDWLGHESSNDPIRSAQVDFVPPEIKDNLNFTRLGQFMGEVIVPTDITVDVFEKNPMEVKAFSSQADLDGTSGQCDLDDEEEDLWHCRWNNVEVTPSDSVSITFQAKDDFGNTAERTLSKSFTRDIVEPQIRFLGTERIFEDKSYVKKSGTHRIILKAQDDGSGLSKENIRLNLLAFGQSSSEVPTECEQDSELLTCFWDVTHSFSSSGVARIGLSKFEDNAGNQGDLPEIELFIDDAGPIVENLEVFGVSDVGDKDYFQSNDRLKIQLTAVEVTGLEILLKVNDIVMDAETKFPETESTRDLNPRDGWQIFNQDSCQKVEEKWECEVVTDPIKSGPESSVDLNIRIRDTAGNDASSWPETARNAQRFNGRSNDEAEYVFDLLGLTEEENPDYWEVDKVKTLIDFVDLDTTFLAPARIPLEIGLQTSQDNVKAITVKVQGCEIVEETNTTSSVSESGRTEPVIGLATEGGATSSQESSAAATPVISRTLLYGQVSSEGESSPQPKMVIEFEPFDAREGFKERLKESAENTVNIPVHCTLQIFSKVGNNALRNAEIQEVNFDIPFGFSELGAMDENLQGKIDDIKDITLFKVASVTRYLNEIIKWANWLINIIRIADSVYVIFTIFNTKMEAVRNTALGSPIAIGACSSANAAQYTIIKGVEWIQIPVAILSCNPKALDSKGNPNTLLGNYGNYQQAVLNVYNAWSGRGLLGLQANSLYENIWTSVIGACVPGILYNLEKYRQVKCREIVCYQKEVPAGIATPDSCAKLGEYLSCRYWKGSLVATAIPLIGAWDAILEFLKGWISSPLGIVRAVLQLPCAVACASSNTLSGYCSFAAVTVKFLDILDALAGLYYSRPTLTQDPYCSQVD